MHGVNAASVLAGASSAALLSSVVALATSNAVYDAESAAEAIERAKRVDPDQAAEYAAKGEQLRHVMVSPETIMFVALATASDVGDFLTKNVEPEAAGEQRDLAQGLTPYRFAVNAMTQLGFDVPTWAATLADKADAFAADAPLYMAESAGKA